MIKKKVIGIAFMLSLLLLSVCACANNNGEKKGSVSSADITENVSENQAETGFVSYNGTDKISKTVSADEGTAESTEPTETEGMIVEDDGDEIVAVDEEKSVYDGEDTAEQALEIKDVRDDNAELPFDTDIPIFAFDTDYTLYSSESGKVRSGAIDAINYINEKGFKWCIISVDYENSKEGRLQGEVLDEINTTNNYLGFYLVNSGADRYEWCIQNGADVLVDDNEDTASLADTYAFQTLLVDADDDITGTFFLHPMGNGSAYGGFKEYVNAIFQLD